jgi:N-acetylglucosaminyl-diphospho-decaprenol L-rhamnosyltransferase
MSIELLTGNNIFHFRQPPKGAPNAPPFLDQPERRERQRIRQKQSAITYEIFGRTRPISESIAPIGLAPRKSTTLRSRYFPEFRLASFSQLDLYYRRERFSHHGQGKEPGMALPSNSSPHVIPAPTIRPRRLPLLGRLRLSVVIVNYRQWDETSELVRQLVASECVQRGAAEVVIVDNHSPKHPAIAKLRRLPHVSLRRWSKNHGFARAVNEGCRLSQGDWLLLLNPDITLSDDFLGKVLEHSERLTEADPRLGVIGFHLRNPDGSRQLSTGPFPTLIGTLSRLALPRRRRKYHTQPTVDPTPTPWVTGCCLMVRRDCLEDVGGLDEQFFLYYEDVDLCQRARAKGWTVWYDPTLAVVHHHPLHSRPFPAALRLVTRHSLLTFARKHWPAWQTQLLAQIVRAEGGLRTAWSQWKRDPHEAQVFRHLRDLAGDFLADAPGDARKRLESVIAKLDVRVGV